MRKLGGIIVGILLLSGVAGASGPVVLQTTRFAANSVGGGTEKALFSRANQEATLKKVDAKRLTYPSYGFRVTTPGRTERLQFQWWISCRADPAGVATEKTGKLHVKTPYTLWHKTTVADAATCDVRVDVWSGSPGQRILSLLGR